MAQPPPLGLERCEGSSDLVLRARADTTTAGEAHLVASVDHQPRRDEQEHPRHCEGAGGCGDDGEGAGRQVCRDTGGCSAQAPVLLEAGEA